MLLTGINGSVGFTASIPTMAGFTGIILMVIYDEKNIWEKVVVKLFF